MTPPSQDEIVQALTEIIHELLARGEVAQVQGLGTFRLHTVPSQIEEQDDGQVVMKPPRDVVAFSPE